MKFELLHLLGCYFRIKGYVKECHSTRTMLDDWVDMYVKKAWYPWEIVMCLLKLTSAYDEHVFHNASESTADANVHSSVPILIFIMFLNAKESKKIVSL